MECIGKDLMLMTTVSEKCPHCGNIVEGRKIKSYVNKLTRQGAKSAAHSLTSVGAMGTGAAVGSAILPGVGTIVGGALGLLGSTMFNQKVNEKIDNTIDKVEDDYLVMDYEFTCPNCGTKWTKNEAWITAQCSNCGNKWAKNEVLTTAQCSKAISKETIIQIVSQITGVEADKITPQSNLCEDLGASDVKKYRILMKLERLSGERIDKKADSIVFVDDLIEAVTGESLWDKEDEVEAEFDVEANSLGLTAEEIEYMEELYDVLADGEISEREHKLLDKIRAKLGISEERGKELEAYLSKASLTTEEQEYLNEYREIVSEGEITPRDQRFLDKLKKVNGISDERAKEIESMLTK